MRRIFFIILITAALNLSVFAQTKISYKQEAWKLGHNLSMATLLNAAGDSSAKVKRRFRLAETNAKNLGITLPKLPRQTPDITDSKIIALYYLTSTGTSISGILREDFGADHAALYDIAYRLNVILILYKSNPRDAKAIVNFINRRAKIAGLPETVFAPLTQLITYGADYEEIKNEVVVRQVFTSTFIAVIDFKERGKRFYTQRQYAKAVAEYSEAIRILPDYMAFYDLRARAYMRSKKYLQANADFTRAIRSAKTQREKAHLPILYQLRGLSYAILGKYSKGLRDLNTSIKLNPRFALAYKIRSVLYRQMGKRRLANADSRKAESLQPGIMKRSNRVG